MAKRKRPSKTTNGSSKTQHTAPEEMAESFRLLDLPPEIRNTIYTFVMADEPQAYLKPTTRGKPFCKSGLARTDRQIRGEVMSLLHIALTDVVAEVRDFDFSHVITFFNSLDAVDLSALPTGLNTDSRAHGMTIKLSVTKHAMEPDHKEHARLKRWLNRLEHPTKQGANVDVTYELGSSVKMSRSDASDRIDYVLDHGLPNLTGRQAEAVNGMLAACEFDEL